MLLVEGVVSQGFGSTHDAKLLPDARCTARWQALNTSPSWIASTGVSRLPVSVLHAASASATIADGIWATNRTSPWGSPTAEQKASHKDAGTEK